MLLILGRSGTQYVAMVTSVLSSYCAAPLAEPYWKKSIISVTNWLRYLFSSYLIKIWLSTWRHHLANLHILKTWISLEWKEIFEKSKRHFSYHTECLFMFENGFNRKDAIFVIVPLKQHTIYIQQFIFLFSYLSFIFNVSHFCSVNSFLIQWFIWYTSSLLREIQGCKPPKDGSFTVKQKCISHAGSLTKSSEVTETFEAGSTLECH